MLDVSREVHIWQTLRERLRAMYELADDDPALIDTLDGETSLSDKIIMICREARETEALMSALGDIAKNMQERKARIDRKAVHLRAMAAWAMQESGLTKITAPDMTISERMGKPALNIDQAVLPNEYWTEKHERFPNKSHIRETIAAGADIPGVTLGNAEPVISIRTK